MTSPITPDATVDTTAETTVHRYTFDTPTITTVYVEDTDVERARDKLVGLLNFGLLLDQDAGDGVFVHQAATHTGHPPILHAIDDEEVGEEVDAQVGAQTPAGKLGGAGLNLTVSHLIEQLVELRDTRGMGDAPVWVAGGRRLRSVRVPQLGMSRRMVAVVHQEPEIAWRGWDKTVWVNGELAGSMDEQDGVYVADGRHGVGRLGTAPTARAALALFDPDVQRAGQQASRPAGTTMCDTCGDHSDSEPGLPCGRVDEDSNDSNGDGTERPGSAPCAGTYQPIPPGENT